MVLSQDTVDLVMKLISNGYTTKEICHIARVSRFTVNSLKSGDRKPIGRPSTTVRMQTVVTPCTCGKNLGTIDCVECRANARRKRVMAGLVPPLRDRPEPIPEPQDPDIDTIYTRAERLRKKRSRPHRKRKKDFEGTK